MIETTAEHPFFVLDRGWVAAVELQPGDRVMGLDHDWINVDAVTTTEHLSKVYNLRVEQDHTYFVGGVDWGFAVWVHNEYKYRQISDELIEVYDDAREAGDQVVGTITKRPKPGAPGQHEYHYKSNHNQDANGNFYTEVFDTPEQAFAKFETEAAKAAAGNATAGLENGPKVDGGAKGGINPTPKAYLDEALSQQGLQNVPAGGFKQKWADGGYDYEVRVHPADPKYGKQGNIYRVARRAQGFDANNQGAGWEYIDKNGIWHHESTLKPGEPRHPNPKYNEQAARDTHIQL